VVHEPHFAALKHIWPAGPSMPRAAPCTRALVQGCSPDCCAGQPASWRRAHESLQVIAHLLLAGCLAQQSKLQHSRYRHSVSAMSSTTCASSPDTRMTSPACAAQASIHATSTCIHADQPQDSSGLWTGIGLILLHLACWLPVDPKIPYGVLLACTVMTLGLSLPGLH
jgi:hypothetical protein